MNDKIKKFIDEHSYITFLIIASIVFIGIELVINGINRNGRIDDTGIRNAHEQLIDVKTEQSSAIESNQQIRDAVERSNEINRNSIDRIITGEERITNSQKQLDETASRIGEGQLIIEEAKRTATESSNLIRESQSILRTAKSRTEKSQSANPK